MLFNSVEYLFFLPVVFLLYWFVFRPLRWQNLFVVAASYVFYGWWDWRFLLLIALTTLCSYVGGVLIERFEGRRRWQRWVSAANIMLNLGILFLFKYYNFFRDSLASLLMEFGVNVDWVTLDVLLPVGISFYTFQALSYTIDVYQRKIKTTHDVVAFFAYISFFPQLVAGPIERATSLLPQFLSPRRFDYGQAVDGLRQILWGLFKKMVIADNCAPVVDEIFGGYASASGFHLFVGAVFFTFQIYGDFSGYSDIAIGTARLFGINLMRNFHFPYFSRDIAEFWRRWHISLNTWFRDYIYIPLGGSRCGRWIALRNTVVVFLVSGLWHGANWTYVAWGAYHALLFAPLLLFGLNRRYVGAASGGRLLPSLADAGRMLCTFLLAVVGWVIFRAENISQAWGYLCGMFSPSLFDVEGIGDGKIALAAIAVLLLVEWTHRGKAHGLQITGTGLLKYAFFRRAVYCVLAAAIIMLSGEQEDFIYFQF